MILKILFIKNDEDFMLISFIIPTVGRKAEVNNVLQSIADTIPREFNYEIIIVDQNCNKLIDDIVETYKGKINITHCKVSFKGAARARNYGVNLSCGKYISFPDDDCRFLSDTIKHAIDFLSRNEYGLVSGKSVDEIGIDSVVKFPKEMSLMKLNNFENKIIEFTFFAKRTLLIEYPFDETLGVGCFHGSDEGYDMVYRMLKNREKLYYNPQIKFYHPQAILDYSSAKAIMRSFTYRCGFAKSSIKNKLYFRLLKRLFLVISYLPFCLVFRRNKVRFYLAEMLGIFSGIVVK